VLSALQLDSKSAVRSRPGPVAYFWVTFLTCGLTQLARFWRVFKNHKITVGQKPAGCGSFDFVNGGLIQRCFQKLDASSLSFGFWMVNPNRTKVEDEAAVMLKARNTRSVILSVIAKEVAKSLSVKFHRWEFWAFDTMNCPDRLDRIGIHLSVVWPARQRRAVLSQSPQQIPACKVNSASPTRASFYAGQFYLILRDCREEFFHRPHVIG